MIIEVDAFFECDLMRSLVPLAAGPPLAACKLLFTEPHSRKVIPSVVLAGASLAPCDGPFPDRNRVPSSGAARLPANSRSAQAVAIQTDEINK